MDFLAILQNMLNNLWMRRFISIKLVLDKFLPSAIKFVYNWNLREMSNIIRGLCTTVPNSFGKDSNKFVRLMDP